MLRTAQLLSCGKTFRGVRHLRTPIGLMAVPGKFGQAVYQDTVTVNQKLPTIRQRITKDLRSTEAQLIPTMARDALDLAVTMYAHPMVIATICDAVRCR